MQSNIKRSLINVPHVISSSWTFSRMETISDNTILYMKGGAWELDYFLWGIRLMKNVKHGVPGASRLQNAFWLGKKEGRVCLVSAKIWQRPFFFYLVRRLAITICIIVSKWSDKSQTSIFPFASSVITPPPTGGCSYIPIVQLVA